MLPVAADAVDPAIVYADLPAPARPGVRLNMIASLDGAATVDGLSGGLGGPADHRVFTALRELADVVLVAAGTVRAERYGPSKVPLAIVTRSCARADLIDELCLTIAPWLLAGIRAGFSPAQP